MTDLRADRERPLIYLAVILPSFAAGRAGPMLLMIRLSTLMRGIGVDAAPKLNAMLVTLATFFLWIPLSLRLSSTVLFEVPRLRQIAESYAGR